MNQVTANNSRGDEDDEGTVDVDVDAEQRDRAGEIVRRADALQPHAETFDVAIEESQPEVEPDQLLEQDGDAPGGQQRVEQASVEPAHDEDFDRIAERGGDDEGERDRGEEAEVQPDAGQNRSIGTNHDEVAVRHVDHPHRAVGDGEAERHEEQDRAEAEADEDDVGHVRTARFK